jgi:hypothetical protein
MSDETTLRKKAREAIGTGRLPSRRPDRMWGGPGNGAQCAICSSLLAGEDMGFELEFACPLKGGPSLNRHVHVRCFAAWELERDSADRCAAGVRSLREATGDGTIAPRDSEHSQAGAAE